MKKSGHPFSLPATLSPDLSRVSAYWSGLKRGGNQIPFADDVNPSALGDLERNAMLVEVFEQPQRFRLNIVGRAVTQWYGSDAHGKFADEIEPRGPLAYLMAQASATVEAAAPTYYQDEYARLLLPLWGTGRIAMLLATIERP